MREDWNKRVLDNIGNPKDMVWCHGDVVQHHRLVTKILQSWKDATALEVGCGYGRFARVFKPENYLGVDSSEEMIKLARKQNPGYRFEVADVWKAKFEPRDLVFEVVSLGPMGMQENEFVERFKDSGTVIMFQDDRFFIFPFFKEIDTDEDRAWFENEYK